jgi:SWI/SNF-related matrix-associated actin-dependent regulator 1 of chromatin subfamily A
MKLKPFQRLALNEIDWFDGRALLALDMGLGKTLLALWYLFLHTKTRLAVVVCPASVKYHWQREASSLGLRSKVLEGRSAFPLDVSNVQLIIVNYDILSDWVPYLRECDPNAVIIDECQYIMSPSTVRTAAVLKLCNRVPKILALSGTPLLNTPIDTYTTLNLLRPETFRSRFKFARRYCNAVWTHWGWKFSGISHGNELHELLKKTVMVRYRKADVLSDLPSKGREVMPVPLEDYAEYNRALKDFHGWISEAYPKQARRALRAEAMTRTGYLLRLVAQAKMKAVLEWINLFLADTDEKLMVYCIHRLVSSKIQEGCKSQSLLIDGSVTGRNRQDIVDRFIKDRQVRILVGNIQAAGVGIDGLQDACSNAAFAELPWRPGDVTQAEDRLWRIGTTRPVSIFYLVAHGTIEERVCEIIQTKQEAVSTVLDGGSQETDLTVFDQLVNELRAEGFGLPSSVSVARSL